MAPTSHSDSALLGLYHGLSNYRTSTLICFSIATATAYVIGKIIYNIWLHPLARYPGPKLGAATRAYNCYYLWKGRWPYIAKVLHERYGDVVRIAPDELSYTTSEAWNDIYGFRVGKCEIPKDPYFYANAVSGPGGILRAEKEAHGHIRKQVSHGFSERALKAQEVAIRNHADTFIAQVKDVGKEGALPINIVHWLNYFTFDVMGELVFAESFDCLTEDEYRPWVRMISDSFKFGAFGKVATFFPILRPLSRFWIPQHITEHRMLHRKMMEERAASRKARKDERLDLAAGLLLPDNGITDTQYLETISSFVVAGSETTATLMSGATYYLLKNPEKMRKVVTEIRDTFSSADEIDYWTINRLSYLLACLNEALRLYPPGADGFTRRTADSPETICGRTVPPHTSVGIQQYSTFRSARNFNRPDEFIPERWLDDPEFADDDKAALQPFSVGPRNCIGKNLANFEMRLLMTMMLWHFDLELEAESENWGDQRIYFLWEKPEMKVKLHPRKV